MGRAPTVRGMAFARTMPGTVLWAWEEPEDLRSADPRKVGVAYLAESVFLGNGTIAVRPRRQPLLVADGAAVMAVVRIEVGRGYRDTPALRAQTAHELAAVAHASRIRALQVDFDAAQSQREFYRAVLKQLNVEMPAGMPLSITALVSWCGSEHGWLSGLPIDEAVPMFFRLGDHTQPYADKSWIAVREPLCRASAGLSIDESWPGRNATEDERRVYLFAPRPWSAEQIAAAAELPGSGRVAALRVANRAMGVRPAGDHGAQNDRGQEFGTTEEQR